MLVIIKSQNPMTILAKFERFKMYKISSDINVDNNGQEIRMHGNLSYPIACYFNDMSKNPIIWHWHEELELIVAAKGSIKVCAASAEKIINEGEGCFINSNVAHSVHKVESQAGILNSIVFHPKLIGDRHSIYWKKYLKPLIENQSKQIIHFEPSKVKDSKIISLIQSAWQVEADEKFGFELEVRNLLSTLVLMLSEGSSGKVYNPTPKDLRDMERTKLMITFIENHFNDELTLNQISKVVSISESECLRCFKRSTGLSPIQFLKQYRLIRAAELIRTTQLNISNIAEQCGFTDMSYFSKSFKEIFNESPTNYRRLNMFI